MPTSELEILYQALASPLGLVLSVSDFTLAQQRLYAARRQSGDPALSCLQLRRSPYQPETELWLVKGGQLSVPANGQSLKSNPGE